jgi:hypothetical protein
MWTLRLLFLQLRLLVVLVVLVARFPPAQGDNNTPNGALYLPISLERRFGQRLVHICRPRLTRAPRTSAVPNTVPIIMRNLPHTGGRAVGSSVRTFHLARPSDSRDIE